MYMALIAPWLRISLDVDLDLLEPLEDVPGVYWALQALNNCTETGLIPLRFRRVMIILALT